MQIALYARVSTVRQADNDLSIPDQLRQMRAWADRSGHAVVQEYIEPGASATDDKRPVFQDMMNDAGLKPSPFQAVVVHSLSRFFRELITGAMYQKTLKKYGVELISITQQTQNDPSGEMQRHIFMLFDQYQSQEISKHTLRGMQEKRYGLQTASIDYEEGNRHKYFLTQVHPINTVFTTSQEVKLLDSVIKTIQIGSTTEASALEELHGVPLQIGFSVGETITVYR